MNEIYLKKTTIVYRVLTNILILCLVIYEYCLLDMGHAIILMLEKILYNQCNILEMLYDLCNETDFVMLPEVCVLY